MIPLWESPSLSACRSKGPGYTGGRPGARESRPERTLPDLVVCDLRLPDGTGEDVFRAASRRPDASPFLFVTGYGDIDQAVRLMRNGAGDYMTKPFDMTDVLEPRRDSSCAPPQSPGKTVLGVAHRWRRSRARSAA